jgi:hypothetical protein
VIAADDDQLFEYPEIIQICEEQGFNLLKATDQISVRIKFELQMKDSSDKILLVAPPDYYPLPDIEECVHFVKIRLKELLPQLSPKIIRGLSFESLNQLSDIKQYENLSDEKTLKFIFDNLYQINYENLKYSSTKENLLSLLIIVLLEKGSVNEFIIDLLASIAKAHFPEITANILSENNFLSFLQTKWELYLNGSEEIDFENYQLKNTVNHLFAVGKLSAVLVNEKKFVACVKSFPFGVQTDSNENSVEQFSNLLSYLEKVESNLETPEKWFSLIQVLSKTMLSSFETDNQELKGRFRVISDVINSRFQKFIETKYGNLFSLSGVKKPVVVSRILEHIKFNNSPRKALFVIDGMNYWQWLVIEGRLNQEKIAVKSGVTFAFIPSITAWSRQSIFRGSIPDLSATNSQEEKLFRRYWENSGVSDFQIDFMKLGMISESNNLNVSDSVKILGLVTNDLDDLMHGTVIGNIQLKQNTELWLDKGNFIEYIKQLKKSGFTVFITADHGSVEASGVKNFKLQDRLGTLSRSKRHAYFSNLSMLANFKEQNPTLDFGISGLSVYLKKEEAFTTENTPVVTHGGSHFWEVLIPFIEV